MAARGDSRVVKELPTAAKVETAPKPAIEPLAKLAPGSAEHKAVRWQEYQERGGQWDYDRWSKQYDVNVQNVTHGLAREDDYRAAVGGESLTVRTPYTDRQFDVYRASDSFMAQIKTGKVYLTKDNILAIEKDEALVQRGFNVQYILEKGASKNFLDALNKAGISYKIGPQIP